MARLAKNTKKTTRAKTNGTRHLRDSEVRSRTHRMKGKLVADKKAEEYKKILVEVKKIEKAKERIELSIMKKLEQAKAALGIYQLEDKIFELENQIDDVWGDKTRFEDLVIDLLAKGKTITGFELKQILKRFSCKYKAICDEVFAGRPDEYQDAKERHGSRKVQHVLVFEGEEVAKRTLP